ncbi:MAG TPA: ribosome maturation factor RimP [Firmicutes bacterium]|nr:ribosome maturation factor RimP [Bacillota bacterium]
MKSDKIEKIVFDLAEPVARDRGCELVDVQYLREAGEWFLRVYIDKPGGVSIDDCGAISEELGRRLDRVDPIPHSYILEVSSSGEKPLRKDEEFDKFAGRMVLINTFSPIDGKKVFQGRLAGLVDGKVKINVEGAAVDIPRDKISKARLVVEDEVHEP